MSLTRAAVRISLWLALAALLAASLRGPRAPGEAALTVLMEPDSTGVWRDLVAQFDREIPGKPVRIIEGPPATNTREDMYSASFLAGKSGYDLVYADGIWIAKFAAAGWLLDLTDRVAAEDRADFLDAAFEAGSYQGRLYMMPALTDAGVLFYRRDLVANPPQTFDNLLAQAREFQPAVGWGFLWQGKQYEGLVTVFLEVLWGYGGEWIDPNSRQVFLNSAAAIQAVEFLRGTVGTISPPAVTTYTEEESRALFQNGRAVFLRNWPYVWRLARESGQPIAGQIAMTVMPHAPGQASAATLGGWGFGISRFTSDPQRAWQFIEFITRPEALRLVQERQGRIPARRSMIPPEFLPILERARPRPAIPEYAAASDILQRWLSAALTGRVASDVAMRRASEETWNLLAH